MGWLKSANSTFKKYFFRWLQPQVNHSHWSSHGAPGSVVSRWSSLMSPPEPVSHPALPQNSVPLRLCCLPVLCWTWGWVSSLGHVHSVLAVAACSGSAPESWEDVQCCWWGWHSPCPPLRAGTALAGRMGRLSRHWHSTLPWPVAFGQSCLLSPLSPSLWYVLCTARCRALVQGGGRKEAGSGSESFYWAAFLLSLLQVGLKALEEMLCPQL